MDIIGWLTKDMKQFVDKDGNTLFRDATVRIYGTPGGSKYAHVVCVDECGKRYVGKGSVGYAMTLRCNDN